MAEAPRLLLLLPGAFSPAGGLEMYCRLLVRSAAEHCAERGGRMTVLSLNDKPGVDASRYLVDGVATVRGFARAKPAYVLAAAKAAVALRPTTIVVGHVNLGPLALSLKTLTRAWQWFFIYGIEAWERLPGAKRFALAQARKVTAISDFTKAECARVNDVPLANFDVLPCALDPYWVAKRRDETPESAGTAPTLLTVTRLAAPERYKGVNRVIEAMPAVLEAVPNARYVVVGSGDDLPRLEALAKQKGVSHAVTFTGRVSDDELDAWYRRCDVFTMPSRKEGFGIVFLEAGYYGKPVVAGNHAGAREVVRDGDTGFLVDHDDVAGLGQRLVTCLKDQTAGHRMGVAGRRLVEERYLFDHFRAQFVTQLEGSA